MLIANALLRDPGSEGTPTAETEAHVSCPYCGDLLANCRLLATYILPIEWRAASLS